MRVIERLRDQFTIERKFCEFEVGIHQIKYILLHRQDNIAIVTSEELLEYGTCKRRNKQNNKPQFEEESSLSHSIIENTSRPSVRKPLGVNNSQKIKVFRFRSNLKQVLSEGCVSKRDGWDVNGEDISNSQSVIEIDRTEIRSLKSKVS